jgi:hypothetical protein
MVSENGLGVANSTDAPDYGAQQARESRQQAIMISQDLWTAINHNRAGTK